MSARGAMRTTREPETAEQRCEREERQAVDRRERDKAQTEALDAAVRMSIKLHGP